MSASLTGLPAELLKRIAEFLPCTSALNLSYVNRQLHLACNDRLVFKSIVFHSLEQSSLWFGGACQWPEGEQYLEDASLQDTVRMAFAVERALVRATDRPDWLLQDGKSKPVAHPDVHEWLPHLLALRYPGCKPFEAVHLLKVHLELGLQDGYADHADDELEPKRDQVDFTNVGFCLAYLTLEALKDRENEGTRYPFDNIGDHLPTDRIGDYMHSSCWGLTPPRVTYAAPSVQLAEASASIIPFLFCIMGQGYFQRIPLPVPSRMPFHTYMDIPKVYRGTNKAFSECHIAKTTTPEFLSGIWMGYFTDQRHSQQAQVDPPMTRIELVARAPAPTAELNEAFTTVIASGSSGRDSHGSFVLHGGVNANGAVMIQKEYPRPGWRWKWQGVVGPFGIFGTWGTLFGGFGGYFWIWKKEWCV